MRWYRLLRLEFKEGVCCGGEVGSGQSHMMLRSLLEPGASFLSGSRIECSFIGSTTCYPQVQNSPIHLWLVWLSSQGTLFDRDHAVGSIPTEFKHFFFWLRKEEING